MVRSVVYAIKTFLNLAHVFIADKRPKNCRLILCYAMIRYVTDCTACKSSIAKQTTGFWKETQDARRKHSKRSAQHLTLQSSVLWYQRKALQKLSTKQKSKGGVKPKTPVQQCRSRNTNVSRGLASIRQKCDATKKSFETHISLSRKKKKVFFYSCQFRRQEGVTDFQANAGNAIFVVQLECLTLKTAATRCFETSVTLYHQTRRNIPEDFNHQTQGTFKTKPVLGFLLSLQLVLMCTT